MNPAESGVYNRGVTAPVSEGALITDPFGNDVPSFRAGSTTFPAANFGGAMFPGTDNVLITSLFTNDIYFYTVNGNGDLIQNHVVLTIPRNLDACNAARATNALATNEPAGNAYTYVDANGNPVFVDGAGGGTKPDGTGFSGVVEGTPTAVLNKNNIDQVVDGGSIQFNWNLGNHKFMIGASIDSADASYENTSQLGFLDSNRKAYLDPDQANPQFLGAFEEISNNNFKGTNVTKSIYFSETWSPVETVHLNASGRYNQTSTKNKIAARYGIGAYQIGDLIGVPDNYNICTDVDGDGDVDAVDCASVPVNYRKPGVLNTLDKPETEKFNFYSFNPSFGGSWQVKENLNIYANWAKGTRTPSVIELGCAFDRTPVAGIGGAVGPRSIVENRFCSLPTTLSGDPFLPQIKATTYDIGMRGTIGDSMQWNLGAYQTDLKNDIYFIAVGNAQGFFDSIGKTRRRGIEAGLSGKKDKWKFGLNYALTDATFEKNFLMLSEDNSSSFFVNGFGNVIQVEKGDRMPGVALHNLNANLSYEVTPNWQVGIVAVAHSESFVRGNENNDHQVGAPIRDRVNPPGQTVFAKPSDNPGKVGGYATFNFRTSYKLSKEWTATMLVTNLFDKEYFTAGRLGRNPFSPSINGAIGPDGYNHNSNDWLSTNFVAPGAPRGVWFSLNWQFAPD